MGDPDPLRFEPQLVAQPNAHSEPHEIPHQGPLDNTQHEQSPMEHSYNVSDNPPQGIAISVIPIQTGIPSQPGMPTQHGFQEQGNALPEGPTSVHSEKSLSEVHEKGYHGLENHEKALYPPSAEERPYNDQNWQIVGLGHVCHLEGCKYVGENNVSRRMHRHCMQLTSTGAKCTYNTERTSNLPGHDRVHLKGDSERDDAGNGLQLNDGVKPKKGVKRKVERVLNEDQQTPFAEVGATDEQVADLQRKGIRFVEDCRLYRPKEVKDCLLGSPREERRETEARQLLVKTDAFLRKSGCWIGDLDLGFSDV